MRGRRFTLMTGDPVGGYELYGVFLTACDAMEWGNIDADLPTPWYVVPIEPLEETPNV
jgi:hypothetical protein